MFLCKAESKQAKSAAVKKWVASFKKNNLFLSIYNIDTQIALMFLQVEMSVLVPGLPAQLWNLFPKSSHHPPHRPEIQSRKHLLIHM